MTNISLESVERIWELTRKLTEDCFPRLTGMEGNIMAQKIIEEELGFCDKVEKQEFSHKPTGFLKFMPYAAILHWLGIIFLWTQNISIAFLFSSITALIFISQLLFYWGLFDFPFKTEVGKNIFGTIEPTDEVKQHVILSGHFDAPYTFTLLEKFPKQYGLIFGISLGSLVINLIGTLILFITGTISIGFTIIVSVLSLTTLSFFIFTTNQISPGAGDNAVAVGLITEAGRLFTGDSKLKHTRLTILALDAEEAGLNGARAYVNEYKQQLNEIPTYNFNIDSIYSKDFIRVFTRDLNSIRKLSLEDAVLIHEISKDLGHEVPLSKMPIGGGSTDSAEFSRIGIKSIALVGIDIDTLGQNTPYHSSRDDMNAMSKDSMEFVLHLLENYCRAKDEVIS